MHFDSSIITTSNFGYITNGQIHVTNSNNTSNTCNTMTNQILYPLSLKQHGIQKLKYKNMS